MNEEQCPGFSRTWPSNMASGVIPIVDFSVFSVEKEVLPSECDESVKRLAAELHEAFSTIGFVYLKGHGVAEEEVGSPFFCLFHITVGRTLSLQCSNREISLFSMLALRKYSGDVS